MSKNFADTPTKRLFKMSAMGAKVVSTYTHSKVRHIFSSEEQKQAAQSQLYSELGEQVMQTLGELKGAAMKLGQVASQLQHMLPEEFTEQIAKLQSSSPPMPYAVIQKQIKQELGFLPEQLFAYFEQVPFAAASIGQVHRATTHNGREIVLKVQYPGVYKSCRSDLLHLKRLFTLSGLFNVEKNALEAVFVEIEQNLLAELDYRQEAKNLQEFRAFHQGNKEIVIPEVITEFSTERVLCLSYEPGDAMASLHDKGYSQEEINRLARHLISAIMRELLYHLRVHCDPHPGNFAFRRDGSVVIYDYGCVINVDDNVVDQYIALVEAALQGEFARIDTILLELGVRNADFVDFPIDLYALWYMDFIQPALNEIRPKKILADMQPMIKKHMKSMMALRGAFKPSSATIFLNRVLGGQFLNLAQMDTDEDFKPLILAHIFEES